MEILHCTVNDLSISSKDSMEKSSLGKFFRTLSVKDLKLSLRVIEEASFVNFTFMGITKVLKARGGDLYFMFKGNSYNEYPLKRYRIKDYT